MAFNLCLRLRLVSFLPLFFPFCVPFCVAFGVSLGHLEAMMAVCVGTVVIRGQRTIKQATAHAVNVPIPVGVAFETKSGCCPGVVRL